MCCRGAGPFPHALASAIFLKASNNLGPTDTTNLCKHVAKVPSPAGVAQTAESLLSTSGPAPSFNSVFKQRTSEQDPEGRSRQRTSPLCCSMYLHADRDTTCDWRFGVMFKERLSISQEVDPATRVVSMDTLHKTRTARST